MSAVVTTYLFGLVYFAATGTYFFYDSYIPIAVFLGMHLLFTDPVHVAAHRAGRIIFGALYGLSTIVLYELLGAAGLPTFYDKLLQVPLLNLSVKAIDRMVRSGPLRRFDPAASGPAVPSGRRASGVHLRLGGGVRGHERGWRRRGLAIAASGFRSGSRPASRIAPTPAGIWRSCTPTRCGAGSGWSCNELGRMQANGADAARSPTTGPPPVEELPILLRGSKGPIADRSPASLYARACAQGWPGSCGAEAPLKRR